MPVPVIIQIAAEKDSSVQRVTTEVSQAIKGLGDAKFDPFTGFSDSARKNHGVPARLGKTLVFAAC